MRLKLQCKKCGHEWVRRDLKRMPAVCPKCHRVTWDRDEPEPVIDEVWRHRAGPEFQEALKNVLAGKRRVKDREAK